MRHIHIAEVFDTFNFRVYETDGPAIESMYPQGVWIASFAIREDAEAFVESVGGQRE